MTAKQKTYRKMLLARIHTHETYKRARANEAWEALLEGIFGVSSSAKLSIRELNDLLDIMNSKTKAHKKAPDLKGRTYLNANSRCTASQEAKIEYLSLELGWRRADLFKYIKRQTGVLTLYTGVLTKTQATAVIVGLKAILKHKGAK